MKIHKYCLWGKGGRETAEKTERQTSVKMWKKNSVFFTKRQKDSFDIFKWKGCL